jgi:hypothetical protein
MARLVAPPAWGRERKPPDDPPLACVVGTMLALPDPEEGGDGAEEGGDGAEEGGVGSEEGGVGSEEGASGLAASSRRPTQVEVRARGA